MLLEKSISSALAALEVRVDFCCYGLGILLALQSGFRHGVRPEVLGVPMPRATREATKNRLAVAKEFFLKYTYRALLTTFPDQKLPLRFPRTTRKEAAVTERKSLPTDGGST